MPTRVYPGFRPDKVFSIDQREAFQSWVERLEKASGHSAPELAGLLDALRARHGFFGSLGAKLSDHGIPFTYSEPCDEAEASTICARTRSGVTLSDAEALRFRSFLLRFLGELDADAGWTKQLQLGAFRNTNRRRLAEFGADIGYDSIGDWPQAEALARYLDQLESAGKGRFSLMFVN